MSFRDNLQHLRATRNMTQEQLAMLVGVSRQSVTKWEAEKAYPEMDKLLKLCQIFDCSLDDLVRGDLTMRETSVELSIPADALADDVIGYDEHQCSFAWRMATGIALCIMGPAGASAVDGAFGIDGLTAVALFTGIGLGIAFILPTAMGHEAFKKAHPYVANFYTDEQRIKGQRTFGIQLTLGIICILAGIAWGALTDGRSSLEPFSGAVFLLFVAAGVWLIVYSAILNERMDIEAYNIDALEELSEEEIAGIVGEDRAPTVLEKVRRSKLKGSACGVIMIVATIVALPLLFWATSYGDPFWSRFFWIPWMVGGLGCAVASIVIDQRKA